jgi:iron complex outermembrane recepter protein
MNNRLGLWYLGFAPFWVSVLGMGTALAAEPSPPVGDLQSLGRPATSVGEWQAQIAQSQARVTQVVVTPKGNELEISLETADGKPLTIDASKFRAEGNTLIADIANTTLALPSGQAFSAENPTADIAAVQVNQTAPGILRVSVVGKAVLPKTPVILKVAGLAYALNPSKGNEDEEVVVTGQQPGYRVPNATTGTKTDTPLRDIPASVQVIPRQVLQDQGAVNAREILRNVSGAAYSSSFGNRDEGFTLRGFSVDQFENGFRGGILSRTQRELANIDRVEVLQGPASILFGRLDPSGVVNYVTDQPQPNPAYEVSATVGSYRFYRPSLDVTGPLTENRNLQYRINLAYENAGSFRERINSQRIFIAPSLAWQITPNSRLSLDFTYLRDNRPIDRGLVVLSDNRVANIPISRILGDPNQLEQFTESRTTLTFAHRFNDSLSLRSAFRYSNSLENGPGCTLEIFGASEDDRNFPVSQCVGRQTFNSYDWQTDLTIKFNTGRVRHNLLIGTELSRFDTSFRGGAFDAGLLDIFNPNYNFTLGEFSPFTAGADTTRTFGIYIQDQITLLDNLKLLVGGRFDTYNYKSPGDAFGPESSASAFTPRFGLVYQPIRQVSLYGSYSQSFVPEIGRNAGDTPFEPRRGTGYELGIKTDLLNNRLSTTLAFYQATLKNVLTEDLDNPGFSVQIGEQRSRGIGLDIAGELRPGWKIIAAYAYIDAKVTADNVLTPGNQLENIPRHSASLWTTYTLQRGRAKGLGLGFGAFFVGQRAGDLENSFTLPGYTRLDAAIFYERKQMRLGLNFKNLSNIRYFEGAGGRDQAIPGAPFTIQGTVSFTF